MESLKETIGKIVRKLRGEKPLLKVAYETRISETYLRQIEKGNANLTIEVLEKLAQYFNIPIVELFGYDSKPTPVIEHKIIISQKPVYGENIENFIPVPLLSDPASLGPGLEINEANIEGTVLIHRRVLRKTGEYQAMFVQGDSMIPLLKDGDIVAIDVKERDPKKLKKKLIACHTGDFEVSIKQLLIVKDKFWFKALNPKWEEEHEPLIVPRKDGLILGKVVWAWREFE